MGKALQSFSPKMFYAVPNFQNPSGTTYSLEKREKTAQLLHDSDTWLIEDDPYGEIRFMGEDLPPIASFMPGKAIMCGSFSKIVAPGLRLGWLIAPENVISKITILKQATDLHSNYFSQRILYQYLQDNDIDQHIQLIKNAYRHQRNLMLKAIDQYFPEEVKVTRPEGGMFLWATLPEWMNSIEIFKLSLEKKVAFVPGRPFYTDNDGNNTMRLNFSNAQADKIEEGIKRLAEALKIKLANKKG
jgi:2-aminoadipate transaminase